ncbi:MAG TPA: hypothetical protein DIS75_08525 [Chryseobacterium sp.]|nr:hypothetical protein [Chryseobacterium sp.]
MHKFSAIAFLFLILFSCKKVEKTSINLELKKELSEIEFRDQALRFITDQTPKDSLDLIAKRIKVDPTYFKNNYKSVSVTLDGENIKRVEEIIAKYGYPGKALVGTPENRAAWIVIQHFSPQVIQKYLPMLREAVKNGDLDRQSLALTEDRNLMYQGKKQIYGSQFFEANGKPAFWPIENSEKVNELRKEAGFVQTIEEYSKDLYGKDFQYKIYTLEEVKKLQAQ